jgi:pimeloyl-ACP methyl ester carboxylesterase
VVGLSPAVAALPLVLLLFASAVQGTTSEVVCSSESGAATLQPYSLTVEGQPATGVYAYPANPPTAIVLIGHGLGGTGNGMAPFVEAAAREGALAVALDFRGYKRAYKVFDGAEDTAAAVHDLRARCGDLPVILWGVSMGGHVSSLAVMQNPGIADYVVLDAAPSNIPQLVATTGATVTAHFATQGVIVAHRDAIAPEPCRVDANDVRRSMGATADVMAAKATFDRQYDCDWSFSVGLIILEAYGYYPRQNAVPPADLEERLIETSPALNRVAWRDSGLRHAYLVHGTADIVVTPDHGGQLLDNLRGQGVPATLTLVAYRGDADGGDGGYAGMSPAWHYSAAQGIVHSLIRGAAEEAVAETAAPEDEGAPATKADAPGPLQGSLPPLLPDLRSLTGLL